MRYSETSTPNFVPLAAVPTGSRATRTEVRRSGSCPDTSGHGPADQRIRCQRWAIADGLRSSEVLTCPTVGRFSGRAALPTRLVADSGTAGARASRLSQTLEVAAGH